MTLAPRKTVTPTLAEPQGILLRHLMLRGFEDLAEVGWMVVPLD